MEYSNKHKFARELYFIIFLCIGGLFGNNTYASHVMGIDVTYECNGPNSYTFTLDLYRDCDGQTPATTTILYFSSPSGCGQPFQETLTLVNTGGTEVSQVCPTQLPQTNCNVGGTIPGTEIWTYQGTVTFPATCSDWTYTWSLCCRNNQITILQFQVQT